MQIETLVGHSSYSAHYFFIKQCTLFICTALQISVHTYNKCGYITLYCYSVILIVCISF